jgi:hypothetical protein
MRGSGFEDGLRCFGCIFCLHIQIIWECVCWTLITIDIKHKVSILQARCGPQITLHGPYRPPLFRGRLHWVVLSTCSGHVTTSNCRLPYSAAAYTLNSSINTDADCVNFARCHGSHPNAFLLHSLNCERFEPSACFGFTVGPTSLVPWARPLQPCNLTTRALLRPPLHTNKFSHFYHLPAHSKSSRRQEMPATSPPSLLSNGLQRNTTASTAEINNASVSRLSRKCGILDVLRAL